MANVLNKVLNFVGWETEEEFEEEEIMDTKQTVTVQDTPANHKKASGKVVAMHTANQFKVVIEQPGTFEEAQEICDHLKNKKPIVVNLEGLEKESARKILDFLSGAVYALDGNIQKVSANIFLIAPCNVDIMSDIKDELKSKGVFPWVK